METQNPSPQSTQSLTENKTVVILTLLFLFPVGLFLMWRGDHFNKPVRIAVSVFWAVLIVSYLIYGGNANLTASQTVSAGDEEYIIRENLENLIKVRRIGWKENPTSSTQLEYLVEVINTSGKEVDGFSITVSIERLDMDGYSTSWEDNACEPVDWDDFPLGTGDKMIARVKRILNRKPWERPDAIYNSYTKATGMKYTVRAVGFADGTTVALPEYVERMKQLEEEKRAARAKAREERKRQKEQEKQRLAEKQQREAAQKEHERKLAELRAAEAATELAKVKAAIDEQEAYVDQLREELKAVRSLYTTSISLQEIEVAGDTITWTVHNSSPFTIQRLTGTLYYGATRIRPISIKGGTSGRDEPLEAGGTHTGTIELYHRQTSNDYSDEAAFRLEISSVGYLKDAQLHFLNPEHIDTLEQNLRNAKSKLASLKRSLSR